MKRKNPRILKSLFFVMGLVSIFIFQNCGSKVNFESAGTENLSSSTPTPEPVKLPKMAFKSLSASVSSACAITENDKVRCWGENYTGELGNNSTQASPYAVEVVNLENVVQLGLGYLGYSCAVLSDAKVKCWGDPLSNPNGTRSQFQSSVPVDIPTSGPVSMLVAGSRHICALLKNKTVQCWGHNDRGQLGNGTQSNYLMTPVSVSGLTNVIQLALGGGFTCGLLEDSTVKCWGQNIGSFGNTSTTLVPQSVAGLSNVVAIQAAGDKACALLSDKTIRCWGSNFWGDLGINEQYNSKTIPVSPIGISNVESVSMNNSTTCVVHTDKKVSCWGLYASSEQSLTPVQVSDLSQVKYLSLGFTQLYALQMDGSIKYWGASIFSSSTRISYPILLDN